MLKEIRIKNFKSFDDEKIFTMEACPKSEISEHEEHVLNVCDNRILKLSSVYGPNGGGKTNLIKAIFLVNQVFNEIYRSSVDEQNPYMTCVFNENDVTSIVLFFVTNNYEIGYAFDIKYKIENTSKQTVGGYVFSPFALVYEIVGEEMSLRQRGGEFVSIFSRNEDGFVTANEDIKLDIILNRVPLSKEKTFLTYVYENYRNSSNESIPIAIFELISEIQSITQLKDYIAFPYRGSKKTLETILSPIKETMIEMMNNADIRITDISVKESSITGSEILIGRSKSNSKKISYIPLEYESNGTRKLFNLLFDVLRQDETKTKIFLVDDLDSKLHPKLVSSLVEYFSSENNTKSQLIFNSHDILNMTPELFRRDEIWFAYRGDNYATELTPLSNITDYKGKQVRKDAKYGKQYLEGRYGADPFIKKGLWWPND